MAAAAAVAAAVAAAAAGTAAAAVAGTDWLMRVLTKEAKTPLLPAAVLKFMTMTK